METKMQTPSRQATLASVLSVHPQKHFWKHKCRHHLVMALSTKYIHNTLQCSYPSFQCDPNKVNREYALYGGLFMIQV